MNWLMEHEQPISVREIATQRQSVTGKFSEKRIQHSMKALETAGLVGFEPGPNNSKLWYVLAQAPEVVEVTLTADENEALLAESNPELLDA